MSWRIDSLFMVTQSHNHLFSLIRVHVCVCKLWRESGSYNIPLRRMSSLIPRLSQSDSKLGKVWEWDQKLGIIVLLISASFRIEPPDIHDISSDFAGHSSHCCHHYLLDQGSSLLQQSIVKIQQHSTGLLGLHQRQRVHSNDNK